MRTRNTQQLQIIEEIFREASIPLSPRQVLDKGRQRLPTLSLGTVYRVLKSLLEDGSIVAIQLPGQAPLYESAGAHHHHFFQCRQCDRMYEIEGCEDLLKKMTPRGFRLEDHEMFLKGTCARCLKRR